MDVLQDINFLLKEASFVKILSTINNTLLTKCIFVYLSNYFLRIKFLNMELLDQSGIWFQLSNFPAEIQKYCVIDASKRANTLFYLCYILLITLFGHLFNKHLRIYNGQPLDTQWSKKKKKKKQRLGLWSQKACIQRKEAGEKWQGVMKMTGVPRKAWPKRNWGYTNLGGKKKVFQTH